MGLFDKLKQGVKSVTDRVTGGYGEVHLELDGQSFRPGDLVRGKMTVKANSPLKVTKLVVTATGLESTSLDQPVGHGLTGRCSTSEETFSVQQAPSGAFEMQADESRSFDFEVRLPENANPTGGTRYAQHSCQLEARVDIPWGADVVKRADLNIATSAPAQGTEGRVEQSTSSLSGRARVDRIEGRPGSLVQVTVQARGAGWAWVRLLTVTRFQGRVHQHEPAEGEERPSYLLHLPDEGDTESVYVEQEGDAYCYSSSGDSEREIVHVIRGSRRELNLVDGQGTVSLKLEGVTPDCQGRRAGIETWLQIRLENSQEYLDLHQRLAVFS